MTSSAEEGLPYLPEAPARGPGADLIGRTAGLLVDLTVDLQPSGWRFVDRPGRDARRTSSLWRQDLDDLAEIFDGYQGDLKVAVAGPWTLGAGIYLYRGERALADPGAVRDLAQSLAEGIRVHLAEVQRLVPGATLVLQVDEPSLPAVLAGRLPTSSGFGRLRPVDPQVAVAAPAAGPRRGGGAGYRRALLRPRHTAATAPVHRHRRDRPRHHVPRARPLGVAGSDRRGGNHPVCRVPPDRWHRDHRERVAATRGGLAENRITAVRAR